MIKMSLFLSSFAFALLLAFAPMRADANTALCVESHKALALFKSSEMVNVFMAISVRRHITQIWMNRKTGAWTATYLTDKNLMCVADEGSDATMRLPSKEVRYE